MIKVSKMTGKMENIPAINTNTTSNPFCIKMRKCNGSICAECYSHTMLETFRKNCVPAFEFNSQLLSEKRIDAFDLPRINASIFRLHGHGELINDLHFENFIFLANSFKGTTFALWTKRKDIVNRVLKDNKKPKNLILVYSNGKLDEVIEKPPVHFDKVFNNITPAYTGKKRKNCTLNCYACQKCYRKGGTKCIVEGIKTGTGRPVQ